MFRGFLGRRNLFDLAVLVVFLIAARAALPPAVKWYVNKTLRQVPNYEGRIGDIDVSLLRGAYRIEDLNIVKTTGSVSLPFISAASVDLSVQWKELFNGALVGEIRAAGLNLNFVKGRSAEESQTGLEAAAAKEGDDVDRHVEAADDWRTVVKRLFPLKINHFQIVNGSIHFKDTSSVPPLDVHLDEVQAIADNLTNSRKVSNTLMSSIVARAKAMGHAAFQIRLHMNPFEKMPTFNMDMSLKELNLTVLNDFIQHYLKLGVRGGKIDVFTELAAAEGSFEGYVKPMLQDVDIVNIKKPPMTLTTVRNVLIEWTAKLLENPKTEAAATKIEFSGRVDDPKMSAWAVVRHAFRNAFVEALSASLEGSVTMEDVKK